MSKARASLTRASLVHLALISYAIISIFPVFLTIINSMKDRNAIFRNPMQLPTPKTFDLVGYYTVLGQGDFATYFQNSFIVTVASIALVLLFGAMAAFALSEYRFRGNTLMGLYLAIGIMIPIRLGTVAILQGMVATGLVNTLTALILVYTAQGIPLAVFILSEFMRTVSDDLKNAGRIDGLSEYSIFFRLVLPLTTAVTHVVMVRAGNLVVGVPSNLVEIVQRAPGKVLDEAYRAGAYQYGNDVVPFFWAGALLQSSSRSAEPQSRTTPVVIFRSAAQRVAVHVDEVLGNQEVVVKALGPQLSRLPGLVAISVLASGAVALIYNPVALAAVYGEHARALTMDAPAVAVDEAAAGAPVKPVPAPRAPHSDIPLVLVVDESITVRRVTQRLLQRDGYRVALAADGLQGLERLQAERPAVVLSDIEMPRMDGFDFVRNIRADEKLADLPVIMITSRIAEKHREHARELGVNHYLGKPYSEDELMALVRAYTTVVDSSK